MAYYTCNYASDILLQRQEPSSCAASCAAMCVKKTLDDFRDAGLSVVPVYFSAVADEYGYGYIDNPGPASYDTTFTAATLLEKLKWGYPVIAQIRESDVNNTAADHYVVVTGFSGNDANPAYSQFTCADPAYGDFRNLEDSDDFRGFYRYIIYTH